MTINTIRFLSDKGVKLGKKITYAVKQPGKDEFWANPQKALINDEWFLVLNDNEKMELIVMRIPGGCLHLRPENKKGLLLRTDKPTLIDLNISTNTFVDRKSGIEFKEYIVQRVKY